MSAGWQPAATAPIETPVMVACGPGEIAYAQQFVGGVWHVLVDIDADAHVAYRLDDPVLWWMPIDLPELPA